MTLLIEDTDRFFEPWQDSYAGRFLVPHPTRLVVDCEMLIVHAFTLSQGEQIAAGCWWNLIRQAPAPWIADPFARLHEVDFPTLERIIALVASMRSRLDPTYNPDRGASTP